jgi:transposase
MVEIATVGLDLAKQVFQVHVVDAAGQVVLRKALRRGQVMTFFAGLPRCLIGIEACATAHHWARELRTLGHEVRLMPPQYVKAYVRRQKNDAADAAAIREAVRLAARAAPPLRPSSAAAASLPSSSASGVCPVAMSTISLPSCTGSRGRFLRVAVTPVVWCRSGH